MTNATGLDCSHFQTNPDLVNEDFVFLKATQGVTFQDPTFEDRWAALKGKVRGAYHFGEGNADGAAQARYFLNFVLPLETDVVILDWEWSTQLGSTNMSREQASDFVTYIQGSLGRKPIVYTGPQFEPAHFAAPNVAACDLWCWDSLLPFPWSKWTFKQNHSGQTRGNEFDGTVADLNDYVGGDMGWTPNNNTEESWAWDNGQKDAVLLDAPAYGDTNPYKGSDGAGDFTGAYLAGFNDKKAEIAARKPSSTPPPIAPFDATISPK